MVHIPQEMVVALRKGDYSSFSDIYAMLSVKMYNYIYSAVRNRADAEDILQKTFLALWENRESVQEDMPFVSYFYKIARNNIYMFLRSKFYALQLNEKLSESMMREESELSETEKRMIRDDILDYIRKVVEKMPERRREIFILRQYHQLSYREIAEKLGISENTVDVQLRKAVAFVKENIDNKELLVYLFLFFNLLE